jgi:dTDP-4-amino-4,6-dideoxygalactose transaminase
MFHPSKQPTISGGAPAFDTPVHVGRPNIGRADAMAQYLKEILNSRWLTNNGPLVQELESRIAEMHGVRHCVAMCNGTIALEIAIRAVGLTGEVIVPSFTFVATAHALSWQEITPVFADIDPATHNLDAAAVERMITPRTTGIIGVHLWGRPAPAASLQSIADRHGLTLIFDAAHAFNSCVGGRPLGDFGRCQVLSFHATKIFNTLEGGAVITNDDDLADKIRLMRNFGFCGYDNVIHPGTNGKMSELNAAMGLVNLEALHDFIEANRLRYNQYAEALDDIDGVSLIRYNQCDAPNYQYVVIEIDADCGATRDDVITALHAENILARKYFWPGCHRMKPYSELYPHAGMLLPESEKLAERVVVLPTGSTLPDGCVETVASVLRMLIRTQA